MNHAHHEYLFDYRYKDLDTGKLNIDKLTTLNGCHSYSDLVGSGKECSVEYYEQRQYAYEQKVIYQQEREKYALEQELRRKEYEVQKAKELEETTSTLRELREYRERLEARENDLARQRMIREEQEAEHNRRQSWGAYIITNSGRIRQG